MERRFACTSCGKCCYGQVPLTLNDALKHAGRFPLAVLWTPVRQGTRSFALTQRLGVTVRLGGKKELAVRIVPTAYIPGPLPCPELMPDNLCAIHDDKPSRCKTMPFSPYRDEGHQADLLIPRTGWDCDTSDGAPVVYRDSQVVDRRDFELERGDLLDQAAALKTYAEWILEAVPTMRQEVLKAAKKRTGGQVVATFSSLLPRLPKVDVVDFAAKQFPVLSAFAEKTAGIPALAAYHRYYAECAAEMERTLKR